MNYWQITASHVQRAAQGQPAVKQGARLPVQSQAPQAAAPSIQAQGSISQGSTPAPRLSFEELYTKPASQLPVKGNSSDEKSGQGNKVLRMMQASPNLTMDQVKAILKVDRFEG